MEEVGLPFGELGILEERFIGMILNESSSTIKKATLEMI
jgi:hypothetical protein